MKIFVYFFSKFFILYGTYKNKQKSLLLEKKYKIV